MQSRFCIEASRGAFRRASPNSVRFRVRRDAFFRPLFPLLLQFLRLDFRLLLLVEVLFVEYCVRIIHEAVEPFWTWSI